MEKQFPKFNVAAQWMSNSGIFGVQVVEVAENALEQVLGGTYAIRVSIVDSAGGESLAFTMSPSTQEELRDILTEAVSTAGLLKGVRRLPTIPLWGKRYFLDERLKELRNVDNPHDRVELRAV